MFKRLLRSDCSVCFIRLSCRGGIQADSIGCQRFARGSGVVLKAPDKHEPQRDEHHRQPEPEKDFEKDASHCSALICFERVDVSDSADCFDALLAVSSRPELFAKVADVNVEAAIESRESAA